MANKLDAEDSFPLEQVRAQVKKTHFRYESRDDPVVDSKQNFKVNFYYQILDSVLQSLNDRFMQLEDHAKLFSFLYNISNTDYYEHLMKCCKDLQIH